MASLLVLENNDVEDIRSVSGVSTIKKYMPESMHSKLLAFRKIRNNVAHQLSFRLNKEDYEDCKTTFNVICSWFASKSSSFKEYPEYQTTVTHKINNNVDDMLAKINIFIENYNERTNILEQQYNNIIENQRTMINKIDDIAKELKNTNEIVLESQIIVSKLVSSSQNEEEEERILQIFSDICVEKLESKIQETITKKQYNEISTVINNLIGTENYKKLDEESISFLSSARIMFQNLSQFGDNVDYSGVCLLVTKALERECKKRFYYDFLNYCKTNYGNDLNQYPSSLLNDGLNKICNDGEYTLGSVSFTLLYKKGKNYSNVDKTAVLNYCIEELFINNDETFILKTLANIGKNIDIARVKYRNPSAHANSLTRLKAKECFDYVLDVQNILKNMLSVFKK